MIKKKKYYVYMHLYNNQPVYIGKGSVNYNNCKKKGGRDDRAYTFNNKVRNERYINFIKEVGKENIEVRILARFDDEQDALWLEDELHEVFDKLYSLSSKQVVNIPKNMPVKPIVQLTMEGKFIREHKSASYIEGYETSNINKCCNKQISSSKGYRWLFADEYYSGDYCFKDNKHKNKKKAVVLVYKDRVEHYDGIRDCERAKNFYGVHRIAKGSCNNYSKKLDCNIYYRCDYERMCL